MAKNDESVSRPRNDAYTGLLAISFLALVGGCVFLYLYAEEMGEPPTAGVKVDVVSGPIGTAGSPLSRIPVPKDLKEPPENKKDPEPPKDPMNMDMNMNMNMNMSKGPKNPEILPAVHLNPTKEVKPAVGVSELPALPEVKPAAGISELPVLPEVKPVSNPKPVSSPDPLDVPPLPVAPFDIPK